MLKSGTLEKGLCKTCSEYGLEYLHLLECPNKLANDGRNPWLQPFDTRSHFQDNCTVCEMILSMLPEDSTGPWRICWVGYGWWRTHEKQQSWGKRDEFIDWQTQRTPGLVVLPDQDSEIHWQKRRDYGMVLPTRKDGRTKDCRGVDAYTHIW